MLIAKNLKTKLKSILNGLRLHLAGLGSPVQKKTWEEQYTNGTWDYLEEEVDHYRAILDSLDCSKQTVSILDIGCGHGVLYSHLQRDDTFSKSSYVGIDISETAIIKAQNKFQTGEFMAGDFDSIVLKRSFDYIIFNETLYYFLHPMNTLKKATGLLNPGGTIIISMCEYPGHDFIWKKIEKKFHNIYHKEVRNEVGQSWQVKAVKPRVYG